MKSITMNYGLSPNSAKQLNINNFILDLRYNPGGEMECVQLLADILVPADRLESPFAFLQYNESKVPRTVT